MHRPIHRFGFNGELKDDAVLPRMKREYERLITQEMRDVGCVPVLDLDTMWSTSYNVETETYNFEISMYGIYVGKVKAFTIEGMTGQGKLHPRNTAPSKSKQS